MIEDMPFAEHSQPSDWLVIASFFVEGIPAGQPRAKAAHIGGFTRMYTPTTGKPQVWKELLFWQAKDRVPKEWVGTEQPVRVEIKAFFPRPQAFDKPAFPSHPFEYAQKPDDDNIRKMVLDVFTNLNFWKDDKQVCGGETNKLYVGRDDYKGIGEKPGALITISVNINWPYKKVVPRNK